jgi:hypothetical protein
VKALQSAEGMTFLVVLTAIAVLIDGFRFSDRQAVVVGADALTHDYHILFSTEGRHVLASSIAREDEAAFERLFSVQCVSTDQMQKKFNGYGISSDVVVVNARFRISGTPSNVAAAGWSKDYDVSATIDSAQYQGLTDPDTIRRVVQSLEEAVQQDRESLTALQRMSNP